MYHAKGGINMLKIENTEVYGWEAAIRGMRNPKNSWDKSDSVYHCGDSVDDFECDLCGNCGYYKSSNLPCPPNNNPIIVGKNDLKLMKTLAKAGADHGKFLRMINVTMDVTAPLYWMKQLDYYKIGTTWNSCSTMHKIHDKEFTLDDFSHEHLFTYKDSDYDCGICPRKADAYYEQWQSEDILKLIIEGLNKARDKYLETKIKPMKNEQARAELMKKYWWQMIQLLPSSYNQKRTIQLNYAVLKTMYFARKDHKLDEWHTFCDWILSLPYFKEICVED